MRYQKTPDIKADKNDIERTVDTMVQWVSESINTIGGLEVLNGNLLDVQLEINKDNYIPHKLARKYISLASYAVDNGVVIWISDTENKSPELYIILQASQTISAKLWVI